MRAFKAIIISFNKEEFWNGVVECLPISFIFLQIGRVVVVVVVVVVICGVVK